MPIEQSATAQTLTEEMILADAQAMEAEAREIYRYLHRHPETAHHEIETNVFLRRELDRLGIPYAAPQPNITIALVDSGKPGATVGLRCDTDALPVREETGLPYASENPGVMHACGHDAHMTIGLCAARVLLARRGQWQGKVKVIFQPAEEGEAGADEVIATGLADDVDVFFAIHVWSPYAAGTLHISPIPVSAGVQMFKIHLTGKGGHGATPEKCRDALVAGAALVTALQSIVARRVSPMEPAVLTIGSFHAGSVGNIIAEEAELTGTLRSLSDASGRALFAAMEEMTRQIASAYGCEARIENRQISGALRNDERAAALALSCARHLVGPDRIQEQITMMLGDDFASYGAIAPICYAQVGIADAEKQTDFAHHNGKFRMDEEALPLCIAWMAAFAARAGAAYAAPQD